MDLAALTRRTPHALPESDTRVVYVDGDGLAYTQSGPAGTSREQARRNVISKMEAAKRTASAKAAVILLTSPGSPKGYRYAVATVKPYQGQRVSGRRPENWEYLRALLESRAFQYDTISTSLAEADDLFSKIASEQPEDTVICTQDKDMRMIPAIHMTWDDHLLVDTRDGADVVAYGLQYGLRWFWLQMLHGDTADFIPGLPKYKTPKGTFKPCGPVAAESILGSGPDYLSRVREAYHGYYGDAGDLHMVEQGVLLWMRRQPQRVLDVCHPKYGPLAPILAPSIERAIMERIIT